MDPVTGQAAYFGIVNEGTNEAIVTVRLRVERRKITEAEWYIGRRGDDFDERARRNRTGRAATCSTRTTWWRMHRSTRRWRARPACRASR